jgi:large repetitive protein
MMRARLVLVCCLITGLAVSVAETGGGALAQATALSSSLSHASLTLSTKAAGATGVGYTVGFKTSATTGAIPQGGSITLIAPQGTLWPGGNNYSITDSTTASTGNSGGTVADNGAAVTMSAPNAVGAGDSVSIAISGVVNPGAGSGYSVSISTASSIAPVDTSPTYTVTGSATPQTSVTPGTFTSSSMAARATGVTYTANFTASSTGGIPSGGSITLVAPNGTLFPANCEFCAFANVVDNTTARSTTPFYTTVDQGSAISFNTAQNINPGDSITLTVPNVTNPATTGSPNLAVLTSSDTDAVQLADHITSDKAVKAPSFTPSTNVAGATGVTYTVNFTASSTGGISSGGSITLVAPPGTVFPANCEFCAFANVVDNTTARSTTPFYTTVDHGSAISFNTAQNISPGDSITLTVPNVTNSSTQGAADLNVLTSSDTVASSLSFTLKSGGPVSGEVTFNGNAVSGAPVQICPKAGGVCDTTTTSSNGTFTLEVPSGTYSATAYPATGQNAAPASVGNIDVANDGVSGVNVALLPPPNLPSGVSITSSDFGQETSSTANPTVNWEQPFQVQIQPSAFPTTNTVITELDVEGTSTVTGLPTVVTVAPGGTVGGVSIPVPAGTPISINALAPIHGPVAILAHYDSYAAGVTPKTGIAYPGELHFAPGGSDQLLQVTNVNNPNGVNVSISDITGPNAADFSIVTPKTEDTGFVDCEGAWLLEANNGTGPENTSCVSQIHWTPDGHDAVEYATAVVDPPGQAPVGVSLVGCNPALTNQCASLLGYGGASATGGGGASGLDDSFPDDNGGGVTGGGLDGGDPYIDPSGEVETTTGQGTVPLPAATVTLEQGPGPSGPFTAVPNGSDVMSPDNRTNPGTTAADGSFGWDTVAGTYDVTASDSGCTSGQLPQPVTVPPPATDLTISLSCSSPPSQTSSHTTLDTSSNPVELGTPLTLTANVGGSNPTGTVTFLDGSSQLGTVPVSSGGSATFTTSTLPAGSNSLTASYIGDGFNKSSTSTPVSQMVTTPTGPASPEILTTSLQRASINKAYSASIVGLGGTSPYQWSVTSGSLPAGLTLEPSTGEITGTPTALGTRSFTVELKDSTSPTPQSTTANLSLNVVKPVVLKIKPTTLPAGTTSTAYSVTVKAKKGTAPYTFGVTSGSLPSGLTLNSSGLLSGSPTAAGTYHFTVGATDDVGNTGVRYYTITVS